MEQKTIPRCKNCNLLYFLSVFHLWLVLVTWERISPTLWSSKTYRTLIFISCFSKLSWDVLLDELHDLSMKRLETPMKLSSLRNKRNHMTQLKTIQMTIKPWKTSLKFFNIMTQLLTKLPQKHNENKCKMICLQYS